MTSRLRTKASGAVSRRASSTASAARRWPAPTEAERTRIRGGLCSMPLGIPGSRAPWTESGAKVCMVAAGRGGSKTFPAPSRTPASGKTNLTAENAEIAEGKAHSRETCSPSAPALVFSAFSAFSAVKCFPRRKPLAERATRLLYSTLHPVNRPPCGDTIMNTTAKAPSAWKLVPLLAALGAAYAGPARRDGGRPAGRRRCGRPRPAGEVPHGAGRRRRPGLDQEILSRLVSKGRRLRQARRRRPGGRPVRRGRRRLPQGALAPARPARRPARPRRPPLRRRPAPPRPAWSRPSPSAPTAGASSPPARTAPSSSGTPTPAAPCAATPATPTASGAVAFSPDGKTVASGGEDKALKIWDADTGKDVKSLTGHTDFLSCLAFSPDGKYLAAGGGRTSTSASTTCPTTR